MEWTKGFLSLKSLTVPVKSEGCILLRQIAIMALEIF